MMESDGERKLDKYYYDLFFPPTDPKANSTASKFFAPFLAFSTGFCSVSYIRNGVILQRPVLSGLPFSLATGLLLAGLAEASRRFVIYYNDYNHRRCFHYMTLHPELFPPPKRIKFADYFDEWETIR